MRNSSSSTNNNRNTNNHPSWTHTEEASHYLFKCKYRRKLINYYNYIIFTICFSCYFIWDICLSQEIIINNNISQQRSHNGSIISSTSSNSNLCENGQSSLSSGIPLCSNHGQCVNNTCQCYHGWIGSNCQFCNGKIRLSGEKGWISDGVGNYTSNMKCTWLIQTSDQNANVSTPQPTPIILRLEEFATECGWDHLYIFDGDSVHAPLLSVFSGLLVQKNYKVLRLPEIVAKSGSALIHFYTDVAYNLTGFNITYRTNSCPSVDSNEVCSGNGVCVNDKCTCDGKWMGDACQAEKCPNKCTPPNGICDMELHKCQCFNDYKGHDCSQRTDSKTGYWEVISPKLARPIGSASHTSIAYNNSLWFIGGTTFTLGVHKAPMYRYDIEENLWDQVHVKGVSLPNVYGHSSVLHENKIFVYGGVHEGKFGTSYVSNELWAFDFSSKLWSKVNVNAGECKPGFCGPIHLTGHSAVVINDNKGLKSRHSRMVVIFGHSPYYGYVNLVQEFHFGNQAWNIVKTKGFPVIGTHGHTSTWDPLSHKIYVFGGYKSTSENALSNTLYSLDPASHTWYLLESSLEGRFLHSAIAFLGHLFVFGGNSHNDTAYSVGTKCFTNEVLVYDIECDSWSSIIPPDIPTDLSRFGHSSVMHENSLYIYGGFNGVMLNDLVKYTPATCDTLSSSTCLERAEQGMRCEWNETLSKCLNEITLGTSEIENCLKAPVSKLGVIMCDTFKSCSACIQNNLECVWCGGQCHYSKCKDLRHKAIVSLEQCVDDEVACGPLLNNCPLCSSESNCIWTKEAKCSKDPALQRTEEEGHSESKSMPCDRSCSDHNTCYNCTFGSNCIWCNNLSQCVDRNAYVVSFPYGQCMSWSQHPNYCHSKETKSGNISQCIDINSCDTCLSSPFCGWCDLGSGTGLGSCMDGSDAGPLIVNRTGTYIDKKACSPKNWNFTNCPACQCNGHSKCDKANKCIKCEDFTTGDHCEICIPGFYGDAINGGRCKPCECNGQAQQCDHERGRCFCTTKGISGEQCERCDTQNKYTGDPTRPGGSCFYDLQIDYQFTFNLSKREDRNYTQINFKNIPSKSEIDTDFQITCSILAKMNISVKIGDTPEKFLLMSHNCTTFKTRFQKTEYNFGGTDNTTFYVYVYDFHPPLWIQISFSQSPKLDLLHFFITFSTCFLLLLIVAAILWKIKQKYDMYRRRQRLFVEMEQMASRPFAQVYIEVGKSYTPTNFSSLRKRRKEWPGPIALEPCQGNKGAVLSCLVSLPTGGQSYAPHGQTAICVASALVALGNPRKVSFEPISKTEGKNSKLRKSIPSHSLSTCI